MVTNCHIYRSNFYDTKYLFYLTVPDGTKSARLDIKPQVMMLTKRRENSNSGTDDAQTA